MLAETSTKDISKKERPEGFAESMEVARRGGNVAGIAKKPRKLKRENLPLRPKTPPS